MATRSTTDITRRTYRVLYGDPGDVSIPADLAEWTTLLGNYVEAGISRKPSLEAPWASGDKEDLDDDTKLTLGYNCDIKFALLQTADAQVTEYKSLNGQKKNIMFLAESANRCHIFKNMPLTVLPHLKGGETDAYNFESSVENAPSPESIMVTFDVPTS